MKKIQIYIETKNKNVITKIKNSKGKVNSRLDLESNELGNRCEMYTQNLILSDNEKIFHSS